MPSKKKEEQPKQTETEAQPPLVMTTEEEARAGTSPQPALVISSIDKSLINTQGPLLTQKQINDLRRKLRQKFH